MKISQVKAIKKYLDNSSEGTIVYVIHISRYGDLKRWRDRVGRADELPPDQLLPSFSMM